MNLHVSRPPTKAQEIAVNLADLNRHRNFGFKRVEVLRGNVEYTNLRMFADVSQAHV